MDEIIKEIVLKMQTGEFSLLFLAVSFLGGALASLSPCSIGILPIIVAYVAGYGEKDNTGECSNSGKGRISANLKTFFQLLFFVLGLSAVLSIIGVACALTGKVFMAIGGPYLILIMASLILVMEIGRAHV